MRDCLRFLLCRYTKNTHYIVGRTERSDPSVRMDVTQMRRKPQRRRRRRTIRLAIWLENKDDDIIIWTLCERIWMLRVHYVRSKYVALCWYIGFWVFISTCICYGSDALPEMCVVYRMRNIRCRWTTCIYASRNTTRSVNHIVFVLSTLETTTMLMKTFDCASHFDGTPNMFGLVLCA